MRFVRLCASSDGDNVPRCGSIDPAAHGSIGFANHTGTVDHTRTAGYPPVIDYTRIVRVKNSLFSQRVRFRSRFSG